MRAYERLLRYAAYPTASHEDRGKTPSTDEQLELAQVLVAELKALGLSNASMDQNGYVMATLPANQPHWRGEKIGFIAHMDVSDDVPCCPIHARLVENYDGKDVMLNEAEQIVLSPNEYPAMKQYIGKTLIVTDGKTLLGADDKAGVAEIMTMLEWFRRHPDVSHGTIQIAFTPDEEIGEGADHFDVARFGADFAFTVDGGAAGEVEYQNFNAASCKVCIVGKSTHTGDAKDSMINACTVAVEYDHLLPSNERPQHTAGYEGFYHLSDISGAVEKAELRYLLRDHDAAILESRKRMCEQAAATLNQKYGDGTVTVTISDSYQNMEPIILKHPELIEIAKKATRSVGLLPITQPVRGGTDGARLSYMGLPCPNLGTGSHNPHSRFEFACAEAMDSVTEILVHIARAYA